MLHEIFKNVRVVELASVLAGPSVGQFLAELGADVIKVENAVSGGDITRSWQLENEEVEGGVSSYFSAVNCGKRSIALDLTTKTDRNNLYKLIEKSQILISSFKKGDAEKLGVDDETLRRINPSLIHGAINGYGFHDNRVGYDAIIQAESGFMYLNREDEEQPKKMPVALMDILAAHQLKEAILAAYIHYLKTSEGSFFSVSLLDSAIASLANQATQLLIAGKAPKPMGSQHPTIVPYGLVVTTKDSKQLLLAVGSDRQFKELLSLLEMPELADDKRFINNKNRVLNRESINRILLKASLQINAEDYLAYCNKKHIPVGEIKSLQDVFSDKQQVKSVLFYKQHAAGLRQFVAELPDYPKMPHITPPPAFDQHRNEILTLIAE